MLPLHRNHPNVFAENLAEAGSSSVVLCSDFDQLKFNLSVGLVIEIENISGAFEVGEMVEQGGTNATGIVVFASEDMVILADVTDEFDLSQPLEGEDSGAIASPTLI